MFETGIVPADEPGVRRHNGGYIFDYHYHKGMLCVLIRITSMEAILMNTHNIPFLI